MYWVLLVFGFNFNIGIILKIEHDQEGFED